MLLLKEKGEVNANEMVLDRQTRKGVYKENISLKIERIIPDYLTDKSVLEKVLTLKAIMKWKKIYYLFLAQGPK